MAVLNVTEDDPLVQTEIFGPILPILTYKTSEDAMRMMRKISPNPLALYIFSEDREETENFLIQTPAGTVSVNDIMGQIAPASLPFGGFGSSGFGSYRGRASIETFSHARSETTVSTSKEFEMTLDWRYPYKAGMETIEFVKKHLEYLLDG
jgi:acyl-CoA reductase-like NAD-dependent aldehyde dehydrogenase